MLLVKRTKSSGCTLGPNPDRRCSPGAYYSKLTKRVICSPTFRTSTIRNVPQSLKFQVEQEYGLPAKLYGRTLEIDHIISLELGGSNDIANLYPEKLYAHPGYKLKDRLENKLHDLVCAGKMTLRTARRGIARTGRRFISKCSAPLRREQARTEGGASAQSTSQGLTYGPYSRRLPRARRLTRVRPHSYDLPSAVNIRERTCRFGGLSQRFSPLRCWCRA